MNKVLGVLASVVILVALLFIFLAAGETPAPVGVGLTQSFRTMLWNARAVDLLGQMLVILAGTFGVLVLTKERIER